MSAKQTAEDLASETSKTFPGSSFSVKRRNDRGRAYEAVVNLPGVFTLRKKPSESNWRAEAIVDSIHCAGHGETARAAVESLSRAVGRAKLKSRGPRKDGNAWRLRDEDNWRPEEPAYTRRDRRLHLSPIQFAAEYDLPSCGLCGAERGDPCRSPSGRTTEAHRERVPQHLYDRMPDPTPGEEDRRRWRGRGGPLSAAMDRADPTPRPSATALMRPLLDASILGPGIHFSDLTAIEAETTAAVEADREAREAYQEKHARLLDLKLFLLDHQTHVGMGPSLLTALTQSRLYQKEDVSEALDGGRDDLDKLAESLLTYFEERKR